MLEGSQLRYYKKRGDPVLRSNLKVFKAIRRREIQLYCRKAVWLVKCLTRKRSIDIMVICCSCVFIYIISDAVWMFRITFAVDVGVKGNRKNRFIDLGAKSMAEAKMWTLALEAAVETLRNHAASRPSYEPSEYTEIKSQAVRKMLLVDDDSFSICTVFNVKMMFLDEITVVDLSKDTQDSERGWWTAKLQDGLRVLQECPCGIEAAGMILFWMDGS